MSTPDPIHLFVPTFRVDEVLEAVRECLEKGWTGLGYKTVEFEEKWRAHTHLPHAHFLLGQVRLPVGATHPRGSTMKTMHTAVMVAVLTLPLGLASGARAQTDKGMAVFVEHKCTQCHSIGDRGNKKGALDDVGARLKETDIRQWIVAAPEMSAKAKAERKPAMKAYTLPKEELDALVAYLASLKK